MITRWTGAPPPQELSPTRRIATSQDNKNHWPENLPPVPREPAADRTDGPRRPPTYAIPGCVPRTAQTRPRNPRIQHRHVLPPIPTYAIHARPPINPRTAPRGDARLIRAETLLADTAPHDDTSAAQTPRGRRSTQTPRWSENSPARWSEKPLARRRRRTSDVLPPTQSPAAF